MPMQLDGPFISAKTVASGSCCFDNRGQQLKTSGLGNCAELTSDPSESQNLFDEDRHQALIEMMIGKYHQIVARRLHDESN